ncbi:MarR family winged helix-turn-helix transcriptional regulator [Amycolatopsis sacchari]|uniref:DNA-binding transcriptional regulator, MarR family n=1 Tax=Amycolatopsis sacchari TaxID=115433 RepID=A0A1I3X3M9_9PSEU|nr:MarR family transcriptional regulator [Amycolatopsis sacchari]SFK13919.1 DNA-binding transcriptional regulator, MarR family [Amycolatopsis sacchari]
MGAQGGQLRIVTALARTGFLVNAAYLETSREYGLTAQQGQLLSVLRSRPMGMGELGAVLGLAKSTVTGLIDRTERPGLVRRERDPGDSRAVRVALTEHGREIAEAFFADIYRRIEELQISLTATERRTLAQLLSRVVADNKVSVVFMEPSETPRS